MSEAAVLHVPVAHSAVDGKLMHVNRFVDSHGEAFIFDFAISHDVQPKGQVWDAALSGDHKAIYAALARGLSTEETSAVSLEASPNE